MHPTLSQLHADHYNQLRLLRCLESEVVCCEIDSAWRDRLAVILDIFDYVQFYPEKYHHPLEDLAYEKLLIKGVAESEITWGLRAEHVKLERLTHQAHQLFAAVANDTVVSGDDLMSLTKEFLQRQLDHINAENRLVYPLLERYLSDADWDEITAKVEQKRDPLFSESVRKEYRNLYKAIMQAEQGLGIGVTARAVKSKAVGGAR